METSHFWPVQYPNFPIASVSGATQLTREGQMGSLCPAPCLVPSASAARCGPSPGQTTLVPTSFGAIISHVTPCSLLQTGALRADDDRLPHHLDPEKNAAPNGLLPFSSPDIVGFVAHKGCEGLAPALGSGFSSCWLFLQTPHSLPLPGLFN